MDTFFKLNPLPNEGLPAPLRSKLPSGLRKVTQPGGTLLRKAVGQQTGEALLDPIGLRHKSGEVKGQVRDTLG